MNKVFLSGAALITMLAPVAAQAAEPAPHESVSGSADFARGEGRGGGGGQRGGGGNWGRGDGGQRSDAGQRQGGGNWGGGNRGSQSQTNPNQGNQNRGSWGGNRGGAVAQPTPAPAPVAPVVRQDGGQASGQYQRGGDNRSGSWNRDRNDDNRGQNNNWNGGRGGDNNRNGNDRNDRNRDGDNRVRGGVYGQQSDRNDRDRNDRDRNWNRGNDRDRNDNWNRNDNRGRQDWNRGWRNDNRYDWQRYRDSHRSYYRPGRYYAPYNYHRYSRISIGFYLGSLFYSSNYWINDPWYYRLPPVYGDYRWVRYYDDVLLIDLRTGYVVDVIENFFW